MCILALLALVTELLGNRFLAIERKTADGLMKKHLGLERILKQLRRLEQINEWLVFICNAFNTSAALGIPWLVIAETKAEPIAGAVLMSISCVFWMKLVSYHHVMFDLRQARREALYQLLGETVSAVAVSTRPSSVAESESSLSSQLGPSHASDHLDTASTCFDQPELSKLLGLRPGERGNPNSAAEWALLRYPENLTLGNLAYFIAAPTLTYQVNYPRTQTIRTKWLLRRIFELIIVVTVLLMIVHQFIEPTIANSIKPLQQMDYARIIERGKFVAIR